MAVDRKLVACSLGCTATVFSDTTGVDVLGGGMQLTLHFRGWISTLLSKNMPPSFLSNSGTGNQRYYHEVTIGDVEVGP
ncbi:hypothetical protein BDZ94DRAFT_1255443 [Collybia nuda]|uniref:Uncharacterized protein n=1 Tax=Collybia nuda TaxID=64659 RepID=A0A9P5YBY7_9AGAR|nr:hypothetical protein BDZ94DRAFT_1255443 [Collybia nuda]